MGSGRVSFLPWDLVHPLRRGPRRQARGGKWVKWFFPSIRNPWGGRSVGPPDSELFLPLGLGVRCPRLPRLCFWQPSRAGEGALAEARNLPGHFCARGGLWQAESHAKRAGQKGDSGLRAALETSAPPRLRLESQETKSGTRRPIREGLWRLGRSGLRGGRIRAGLPSCGQFKVGIWVWMQLE